MQAFEKEVSLDEGFEISLLDKNSRLVAGKEVSLCSGILLFQRLRDQPIVCWVCQAQADRWVIGKARADKISKPVLNLFATNPNGQLVMMTRDHIIPKSLGGTDSVGNLRPGCEICNSGRGNTMNAADRRFMAEHPEFIDMSRVFKGRRMMLKKIEQLGSTPKPSDVNRLIQPFLAAQKIIDRQHTR